MRKASLLLGAWAQQLSSAALLDKWNAGAPFVDPHEIKCAPALIAALVICGVLSAVSLLVPPFVNWDSANGFLAWRGTLLGAPNSIIAPDPTNIARDTV